MAGHEVAVAADKKSSACDFRLDLSTRFGPGNKSRRAVLTFSELFVGEAPGNQIAGFA